MLRHTTFSHSVGGAVDRLDKSFIAPCSTSSGLLDTLMPSSHPLIVVDICAVPVSNVSEPAGILYQDLTDHHPQHWKNWSWSLLLSHWNMSLTWCGSYLVMHLTDPLLAAASLLFQLGYCLQLGLIDIDPIIWGHWLCHWAEYHVHCLTVAKHANNDCWPCTHVPVMKIFLLVANTAMYTTMCTYTAQ